MKHKIVLRKSVFVFIVVIVTEMFLLQCESQGEEKVDTIVSVQMADQTVSRMELERYLVGVVLAETPSDFLPEALKSQAIAARTFSWKAHAYGSKHTGFDLCVNPACCQGYLSEEEFLRRTGSADALLKIQTAVRDTSAVIITYEDLPIEATYFSCSGGFTEGADEVWGCAYPYLTAKESPGEESAFCYEDSKVFTQDEFRTLLALETIEVNDAIFSDWEYTQGGGVASVEIENERFSGTELRKLLGLRSTWFSVLCTGDTIQFNTHGYGHRVGMSQYGANAMASCGKKYNEILEYYYSGTQLIKIPEMDGLH